jgi:transposase
MEALLPICGPARSCSAPPVPTEPCPVCPRLAAEFEPWRQAAYWQGMHQRAVQREQRLQQDNQTLQARIRSLEQRLFGRKTENAAALPDAALATPPPPPPRPRGQQRGRPGPQRRDYSHLPVVEETLDVPTDQQQCPQCGQAFAPFPGTDDSTVLEVEVRAHRRLIRRRRYRPTCGCGCNPGIVTAPPPPKVLPKSLLGVSIWVRVLLDKYLFYRPTYRLLDDLATEGLPLSLGTITDGLQRLLPLLQPLYDALVERSRQQTLWHADETRWLVYASVEGKVGYRWYLWVFHGDDVVVFVLASGRAHDVPEEHLGPLAEGILVVDRYAAYKALPQVKDGRIVLAFCWAHVRRDFVEAARSWPALERWGLDWVERIGAAYRDNDARLAVRDDPAAFARADQALRRQVAALAEQSADELREDDLHSARRKTLESLQAHWQGLTVFVDHPDVPMDNNTAERVQRGPVVGRKNYYGSGAEWSGRLAALLFSLFQTLALGHLNPRLWLTAYLEACAAAGGRAPADATAYLPWNLTEQQKQQWRSQPPPPNTS